MKSVLVLFSLCFMGLHLSGQLRGSGKTIEKSYDFKDFDKLYLNDLDGKIDVEIGKQWSIQVSIDENLFPLLSFDKEEKESLLKIFMKGNNNNRIYIEDTNIRIKITMPEASVIRHDGNSILTIYNINGRYFRLENLSNGAAKISGSIDELDIINKGNANLNAQNLTAKNAEVKCSGNGNVSVNVSETIKAIVSGNGNISNKGNAPFQDSSRTGNGKFFKI